MKNILNYSQPSFYSFTSDSLELVKFGCSLVNRKKNLKILDLCSGCGVIGIEAALELKNIESLVFLEHQKGFLSHLTENLERSNLERFSTVQVASFGEKEYPQGCFDYIFCNPPYFKKGEGRESSDINRQICRTFEVDDLEILLLKCSRWVSQEGYLFLSTRNLEGVEANLGDFKILKKKKLSGTWLICLSRLNID